jgi:DNA-binding response OmpR family regulator
MLQYPHERFHARLIEILDEGGESNRRLGYIWAAETDEDPSILARRVDRLRRGLPKPAIDLISLIDALGYRIEIKKGRR